MSVLSKVVKKDYTVEFVAEIVEAISKEEALDIAKKLIRDGQIEVDCVEETDYDSLTPVGI